MVQSHAIRIGCAGWSLRKEHQAFFPEGDSHLERYAQRLPAVEINTSFKSYHRPSTYARWASSVPENFRFSVKVHRQITHDQRLSDTALLDKFRDGVTQLGERLGPVLVQLPPSLEFMDKSAERFFSALRQRFAGDVVCEPRHATWFEEDAEKMFREFRIARVAADPAQASSGDRPGGWDGLAYYRLHGSPRVYYSSYSEGFLSSLLHELQAAAEVGSVWCIFDNTASGAAMENALWMLKQIEH
jgi:uncharacterized protein YecE (DUF72 family)